MVDHTLVKDENSDIHKYQSSDGNNLFSISKAKTKS